MLPGMSARSSVKPHIAIVGAGNLASALAVSLREAGYVIEQIISRSGAASFRRARRLARKIGAPVIAAGRAKIRARIVWFCVPDGAISAAAQSLAEATDWSAKVALHSSGALTSDELAVLRKRGAAVASVHPLMTFVRGSRPALDGVPFAIEGDSIAVRTASTIVRNLRGQVFTIRKEYKEAYHAWGTFASPLLTALLAASERVAVAAGVNRKAARERMLPILRQTLANYALSGASESFSGPVPRGDVATVRKHLKVLAKIPQAREVYIALTRVAIGDLPARNRAALEKILRPE
jgi:predicted short-subunit dehydrogenase-like oxidoreductase (DUF2520 family)